MPRSIHERFINFAREWRRAKIFLILKSQTAVRASNLAIDAGDDFEKIIALHTYSRSDHRNYEIELQDNWISMHGFRFQEFMVKRKA